MPSRFWKLAIAATIVSAFTGATWIGIAAATDDEPPPIEKPATDGASVAPKTAKPVSQSQGDAKPDDSAKPDDHQSKADKPAAKPTKIVNHVRLELRVSGMSDNGCQIEIKPGHPACRFKPITYRTKVHKESITLPPLVVETSSADRNCSFDITIREKDRPVKSAHRSVRLTPAADDEPVPVKRLTCYLTAPSLAAKADGDKSINR